MVGSSRPHSATIRHRPAVSSFCKVSFEFVAPTQATLIRRKQFGERCFPLGIEFQKQAFMLVPDNTVCLPVHGTGVETVLAKPSMHEIQVFSASLLDDIFPFDLETRLILIFETACFETHARDMMVLNLLVDRPFIAVQILGRFMLKNSFSKDPAKFISHSCTPSKDEICNSVPAFETISDGKI